LALWLSSGGNPLNDRFSQPKNITLNGDKTKMRLRDEQDENRSWALIVVGPKDERLTLPHNQASLEAARRRALLDGRETEERWRLCPISAN